MALQLSDLFDFLNNYKFLKIQQQKVVTVNTSKQRYCPEESNKGEALNFELGR